MKFKNNESSRFPVSNSGVFDTVAIVVAIADWHTAQVNSTRGGGEYSKKVAVSHGISGGKIQYHSNSTTNNRYRTEHSFLPDPQQFTHLPSVAVTTATIYFDMSNKTFKLKSTFAINYGSHVLYELLPPPPTVRTFHIA